MSLPVRVGAVPYLNGVPLVAPLEADPPAPVKVVRDVPSRLLQRLLQGDLEVALVSSIASLRYPQLGVVPGIAIACRGPVESVKLVSRVDPQHIRTLALDRSSLTSAVLVQVLLRERYGVSPETIVLPPNLPAMLTQADAAVIIGDPGLASDSSALSVRWQMDPGEEWYRWTGLSFVFALWVYRRGCFREEWASMLQWAKQRGLQDLPRWARQAALELDIPADRCESYLRDRIRYDLGPEELKGLQRFGELAKRHGLL